MAETAKMLLGKTARLGVTYLILATGVAVYVACRARKDTREAIEEAVEAENL